MPTPVRHVRVPDPLWKAAKEKALSEYRTVADVIIECLRRYVNPDVIILPVSQQPEDPVLDENGLLPGTNANLIPERLEPAARENEAPVQEDCPHVYPDVKFVANKRVCRRCD